MAGNKWGKTGNKPWETCPSMKHSLSGIYEHSSSLSESQKHKSKDAI